MKRKKFYVDNRRKEILKLLYSKGTVTIDELLNSFNVSAITIRRDLQYLEDNKELVRFYGGATIEKLPLKNEVEFYKTLIAKYASTLINDNETVFINSSSTTLKMLDYVNSNYVTFITNNAKAISVNLNKTTNVILTGGEIRHPKEVLVGDFALKNIESIYAKKAFIGCNGISVECGMTTTNANEVNINKAMIKNATRETYFLADHTKIGKHSNFISCDISEVKHLITDEKASLDIIENFREKGITVHIVKK